MNEEWRMVAIHHLLLALENPADGVDQILKRSTTLLKGTGMDHQLLFAEMTREHRKWAFSTKVYGTLYPAIRFYLIVASGLVAAKEPLTTTPLGELALWVPVLAVSVPIVTALDTWLKPRDKWRVEPAREDVLRAAAGRFRPSLRRCGPFDERLE